VPKLKTKLFCIDILIMKCFLNDLQSVNFENQIADDDVNSAYSSLKHLL